MKVSRLWLAAIGLITLGVTTLFMIGAEVIAPDFNAHLPYLAILLLAWVVCVPSIANLPKLIRRSRQGPQDEGVTIDLSRRTMVICIVVLAVGVMPLDHIFSAVFGKLVGLGIALTLASMFKQSKPTMAKE